MTFTTTFDKDGLEIKTVSAKEADPHKSFKTDCNAHSLRIKFTEQGKTVSVLSFYRDQFRV